MRTQTQVLEEIMRAGIVRKDQIYEGRDNDGRLMLYRTVESCQAWSLPQRQYVLGWVMQDGIRCVPGDFVASGHWKLVYDPVDQYAPILDLCDEVRQDHEGQALVAVAMQDVRTRVIALSKLVP